MSGISYKKTKETNDARQLFFLYEKGKFGGLMTEISLLFLYYEREEMDWNSPKVIALERQGSNQHLLLLFQKKKEKEIRADLQSPG